MLLLHDNLPVTDHLAHRGNHRAVGAENITNRLLKLLVYEICFGLFAIAKLLALATYLAIASLACIVVVNIKNLGVRRPDVLADLVLLVLVIADVKSSGVVVRVFVTRCLLGNLRAHAVSTLDVFLGRLKGDKAVFHVGYAVNVRLSYKMLRRQARQLHASDRVVRCDRIVPLDKPYRAAVDRAVTLIHVVHSLIRQIIAQIAQKHLNAPCVALVALAPHLRAHRRIRDISRHLALDQLVSNVSHHFRLHVRAVDLGTSAVLLQMPIQKLVFFVGSGFGFFV